MNMMAGNHGQHQQKSKWQSSKARFVKHFGSNPRGITITMGQLPLTGPLPLLPLNSCSKPRFGDSGDVLDLVSCSIITSLSADCVPSCLHDMAELRLSVLQRFISQA